MAIQLPTKEQKAYTLGWWQVVDDEMMYFSSVYFDGTWRSRCYDVAHPNRPTLVYEAPGWDQLDLSKAYETESEAWAAEIAELDDTLNELHDATINLLSKRKILEAELGRSHARQNA